MASSVDIVPSLGQGLSFLQEGPGASPGYGAIDRRRMLAAAGVREGIVHENAYAVSAAGTGMTVLVDADAGLVNVQGDSVAQQGLYTIAPHNSDITLDIAAAHATLPRNDLVVLDALDDDHDNGGLNKARVRVITGTPTSGAVQTDAFGVHGTPSPGNSQLPLAVVNVPATDTVITTSQIDDRRFRTCGASIVAGAETRTSASYGLMPTPDRVRNLVVPTNGLLVVSYQAMWQEAVADDARAAIFIGPNQLKVPGSDGSGPAVTAARMSDAGNDNPLATFQHGLISSAAGVSVGADVTTGQTIGNIFSGGRWVFGSTNTTTDHAGGECRIFLAAGVYDVSVQFKAASGVTAKNRKLWVESRAYPA